MKYHHPGVPVSEIMPDMSYLPLLKMYQTHYTENPYGIEWLYFEPDCPLPELIKRVPHPAFEVSDLKRALAGKEVIIEPISPSDGVSVAFIVDRGVPVAFLQYDKKGINR